MKKKIPKSKGASLPVSATIQLPPAQASQMRTSAVGTRADRVAGGKGDHDMDDPSA